MEAHSVPVAVPKKLFAEPLLQLTLSKVIFPNGYTVIILNQQEVETQRPTCIHRNLVYLAAE
jgi:hypothetical protein